MRPNSNLIPTLALLCLTAAVGCGDGSTSPNQPADMSDAQDMAADMLATDMGGADMQTADLGGADMGGVDMAPTLRLQTCVSAPHPAAGAEEDWRHTTSSIITAAGDPDHSAQDVITADTRDAHIVGKFAYGAISKDLEDELVEIWMDDCSGAFQKLGEALTDSDGRIDHLMKREALPAPGLYKIFLRVKGDQSDVVSYLRVLPEQTKLIVFDIDGTLTPKDSEIFQDAFADYFNPILSGDYVPESREKAQEITTLRAGQGYQLVYLTGRPYVLTRITRQWLKDEKYAPGHLHVTNSNAEVLPTTSGVGNFKRAYLLGLKAQGFVLSAAYGNASTDIYAYGEAGVAKDRTWIAGELGGEEMTQAVGEGYATHLGAASAELPPAQPFAP